MCPGLPSLVRLLRGRQVADLVLQPDDVPFGLRQAGTHLVDHVVRGLRQERLVTELGLRLGLLLLGRSEVLGQPLALGRDVDRARQVERDRGAGNREGRRGAEAVTLRLEPEQLTDGGLMGSELRTCQVQTGQGPSDRAAGLGPSGSGEPR